MTRFFFLALALAGSTVSPGRADDIRFHQPPAASPPEILFGADATGLDGQIGQALSAHTGFADLREFAVHWDRPTFRCLLKSHELHEVEHGVCLVEASAFQVAATALIVKGDAADTFEVSILTAAIE